jgi:hypothetical protein
MHTMIRPCLLVVLAVGLTAGAPAQSPPPGPRIELGAAGSGTGTGSGTATVSGTITCPAPWQLSIHVVTVRFQKAGGTKTLNALIPVKGDKFSASVDLKAGSYRIWAVIDVKDADGREKQVASDPRTVTIQ